MGTLPNKAREQTGDTPSGRGGWSSLTMANSAGMAARLWYGGFPCNSSITVPPTLQMSEAEVAPESWMISGAIQ